ncbi:unnamed protein product [Urochloa decumbens]|uniref:F-box domain-containing protein n=1 Tax=Urochloa decumbens TaxID=240449 RepID=A0ABC9FMB3_9POAL
MLPPPPPPPELMEELVEEVLLRLPPSDPASLVRAALVCRLWCRLATGAAFRRRFREFHSTPPMLGFICDGGVAHEDIEHRGEGVFIPTTSFFRSPPLRLPSPGWRWWDSRHGRVLLHDFSRFDSPCVWKPITGSLEAPLPKIPLHDPDSWTAAVLCAATTSGTCDHLDCHDDPFVVVLVGTDELHMFSYVYSSEYHKWSESTTAKHPGDCISSSRSALVGSALYFLFYENDRILKYDLKTREMTPMELIPCYVGTNLTSKPFVELMSMEDGRLGFARLEESRLCLWSRDFKDLGWMLSRVIELDNRIPFNASLAKYTYLAGFAEGVSTMFVSVGDGVFAIDLKSSKVMKVYEGPITCVVPYMSFCTPALREASTYVRGF